MYNKKYKQSATYIQERVNSSNYQLPCSCYQCLLTKNMSDFCKMKMLRLILKKDTLALALGTLMKRYGNQVT